MLADRLLDPTTIQIQQTDHNITLTMGDKTETIDQVVLCFPFSTPTQWISLRKADGTELGLLKTVDDLPEASRHIVEKRLKDRYHIPTIVRVVHIEMGSQGTQWQVETEEGETTFSIRGERSINTGEFPKIILTDASTRQRYAIVDYTKLDRSSQQMARANLPISSRGRGRGGRPRF